MVVLGLEATLYSGAISMTIMDIKRNRKASDQSYNVHTRGNRRLEENNLGTMHQIDLRYFPCVWYKEHSNLPRCKYISMHDNEANLYRRVNYLCPEFHNDIPYYKYCKNLRHQLNSVILLGVKQVKQ